MMPPTRRDYKVPFGIDPTSRRVSGTDYPSHVEQMIMQVLFTSPGERVDLPQFGCGLRQLVFAPLSDALAVNTQINVRQALGRWLAGVIDVGDVTALTSDDPGGPAEPGTLVITISYMLLDTLTTYQTRVILP
ncbi:MAG TPA: GPW/gp25 family protein [Trebonia sp.]|nr:GPW/gp25 family protein [Trebonia sp.]